MKKLFLLLTTATILFFGCKKDEETTTDDFSVPAHEVAVVSCNSSSAISTSSSMIEPVLNPEPKVIVTVDPSDIPLEVVKSNR